MKSCCCAVRLTPSVCRAICSRGRADHWNCEEEVCASSERALYPDLTSVRADNPARDRETQATPLVMRLAAAPVTLEEVRDVGLADSWTVVRDHEQDLVPPRLGSEGDDTALRRSCGGVPDQIGEDLKNPIAVAVDLWEIRRDLGRQPLLLLLRDAVEAR